jgi:PglZ domain-containing protein
MTTGPTPAQVAAQVAMVRRHRPEARVIGMHTPGGWLGGATLQVNGESCNVIYCSSGLQVREALASLKTPRPTPRPPGEGKEAAAEPLLVVITPLNEAQLGLDVLARLAGRQLYRIDHWQMVRDLFHAREVDPRLPSQTWLAEALLQHVPQGGYPPVASGLLDTETVWKHLLAQCLELREDRPDAVALLTWSLSESNLRRYEALSGELRTALRQRVQDTAGAVGVAMLDALDAGHGALLVPIGLVCDILFAPGGQRQIEIAQARARLEPYLAGRLPSSEVGRAWAAAAASALASLPASQRHDWLARAEQLLTDLKASEYSALSTVLHSGWQQRLSYFATALQGFLRGKVTLDQLEERFNHVACHQASAQQGARLERVCMALRLARYLQMHPEQEQAVTLAHAARLYAEHGGYVDWARRYLLSGDETADLAAAFGLLTHRVRQRREQQNKQFAALLAAWHQAPGVTEGLLPIEQALSQSIARLARATPLLLLVMDALSYADCCELLQDLGKRGWMTLTDQPGHPLPFLVSTVPSVTALARASLFSGKLARGTSAVEKQNFAAHAELLAVSRSAYPPVLFHKGELLEGGTAGLSSLVRQALRHEQQRVVGVVVNAVDDHLAKSEQLRLSWTVDQFQHLDALLYEAQVAQRAVVVTSDHGHVLEAGSRRLAGSAEERWRPYADNLAAEELVFEGPRVQQVTGVERIIAPWSEAVRYSQKKQGYHGGATPQEVLVPLAVLVPQHRTIAGWEALPDRAPAWWSQGELPRTDTMPAHTTRRARQATARQGTLFAEAGRLSAEESRVDWIEGLLSSPVFAAQRRVAGRRAPDDQRIRVLLTTLETHHGRIACRLLEQTLGEPAFRLRGTLAGVQRLLNVDGYQVLVVDDLSGTVALNRQLLNVQFQLEDV